MFDLTNVKAETPFEPLADGEYLVTVEDAQVRTTKAGTGEYISLKLKTEKNRVIFTNFNVKNDNEKAVQIGLGQFKAFLTATGRTNFVVNSMMELTGLQVIVKLSNGEVKAYKPVTVKAKTDSYIPF